MRLKNPTVKKRSETEIVASILDGLEALRMGSFNRINNAPIFDPVKKFFRRPPKHTPRGISDIIGTYQGRYICIEAKTHPEYKKVVRFLESLQKQGIYICEYLPRNDWEERVQLQAIFIMNKIKAGGFGFFTYGLDHTVEKLKSLELKNEISV